MGRIRLKRAYENPGSGDGTRVLVERLWPRGVRKADAAIDLWLKEIAPSTALRKWYGHDRDRWDVFRRRYGDELDQKPELVERLEAIAREGTLTLVLATKDVEHSGAAVLRERLEQRRTAGGPEPDDPAAPPG